MKRIEDIKEFEDIDTYYGVSELVEEVFQDRVETHKHLVTTNKEIERLKKGYCELKEKCNKGECDCTHEEYNGMCEQNMKMDLEIERLNNIIKRTDSWIDRTIEIIKQQPSEDDTWILERLKGIKQCLKGVDEE